MQTKQDYIKIWLLFLISPLFALIVAIKEFKSSWAKNILWAFIAFYGFTYVVSFELENSDITRYEEKFKSLYSTELDLKGFTELLYNTETGNADIFIPTINYLLSRFTNNSTVLITTFAIIFGYFYSRNLWYIISRLNGKILPFTAFLIIIFALIVPIWNITGIRFWLATHVFLFGVLPYLMEGKKNKLIFSFLAFLIHFSFLIPLIILIIYFLIGSRVHFYFLFFLSSFLITEINVEVINTAIANYLPEVFYERAIGYTSEADVQSYGNRDTSVTRNWYVLLYQKVLNWSVVILIIFIYWRIRKNIQLNKDWLKLFSFVLLFYGITNILSLIPSGGRFLSLANLLSLAFTIQYFHYLDRGKAFTFLKFGVVSMMLLFAIVNIRRGFNSIGLSTFLSNPIISSFIENDVALIELIK